MTTTWLPGDRPSAAAEAWERVRTEVAAGHRAFVVCPLVEGSVRVEAKSATEEFERLAAGELVGPQGRPDARADAPVPPVRR